MKAKQDFVVPYSPWLSRSVERINRDVLQVLRAMILEYSISYQDWVYLMPLVQANLNHSPVQSLAGKAPIVVFTGLPCPSPTSRLFVPGYDPINVDTSTNSIDESMRALRISIEKMHQEVTDQRGKRTLLNKKRAEGHQMVNFTIGDYVLRSRVDVKKQNKLLVTWMGPYVVTKRNTHSFTVKHLFTGKESNAHASRLKFFAEGDLEMTEELREHVSAQGVILKVEAIRKHRWNPDMRDFELLIGWEGLEPIEDSWEPMNVMHEDIEVLVGSYVGNAKDKELTEHYNWLKA